MYFVIEIQNGNYLVVPKATDLEAQSEFHRVCSAAALSDVHTHACTVLDNEGNAIWNKCFIHE